MCVAARRYWGDLKCPECNVEAADVVYDWNVVAVTYKTYVDFRVKLYDDPLDHSDLFKGKFASSDSKIKEEKRTKLICVKCPLKYREEMPTLTEAKFHYKTELVSDNLYFCLLCLKYEKKYFQDQLTYTDHQLKEHLASKTPDGHSIHPECPKCKERQYSKTALDAHIVRNTTNS
eukprot:GHVP01070535.1.p1 GENE.GHVP01070535.1~~GHVP01070535.1.p1  ORF type:complete len:175 (+),score=26.45 GHVP01070535.1:390-914(+)